MTGKTASNTVPKPTEWIIENVLPKGFNSCLAGTTGSKKSMWAIQLGLSVASGEKDFVETVSKAEAERYYLLIRK